MDRNARRRMMRSAVLALASMATASLAEAQTATPEELLQQAQSLVQATSAPYDTNEAAQLRQAREILDRIISEHPTSDIAVRVLIQDSFDGLDVARLDAEIATLQAADNASAFPVFPTTQPAQATQADAAKSALPVTQDAVTGSDAMSAFPVIPMVPETATPAAPTASEAPATGAFPIIAAPSAAAASPELPIEESLRSVGNCYVSTQGAGTGERIVVEVDIDDQGRIAAMPRLLEPSAPSPDTRQLFITVVTALDSCAPYAAGAGGSYRIAATANGVERIDEAGGPTTAAPTTSAAAGMISPSAWVPASQETQDALEMSRREKAELQARLTAMGYNPRGIDGVPGKGTRAAVSEWQTATGIPATGYLDRPQMTAFLQQSNAAYEAWLLDDANKATVEAAATKRAATKKSTGRRKPPPGYFWYKGRLCRKVLGNAVLSCK